MISETPLKESFVEDTKQDVKYFVTEPPLYVTVEEDARVLKKIDRWYRFWLLSLVKTDVQVASCPSCL